MVIELCTCNDDIPGVKELPPHLHRDFMRILIQDETHRYNGDIIEINTRDWRMNSDNPSFVALERIIELSFAVNWKEVMRGLQG